MSMRHFGITATLAIAAVSGSAMAETVNPGWGTSDEGQGGTFEVRIGGVLATTTDTVKWTQADPGSDVYLLANPITWSTGDSTFSISSASFDTDPVLFFTASATNTSNAALSYSFTFNTPLIPPLTGLITSQARLTTTLGDGQYGQSVPGAGYAGVYPTIGSNLLYPVDLPVTGPPISKNVDLGGTYELFNQFSQTWTDSRSGSLVCPTSCTTMSATLAFSLSAGDGVTFIGQVTQTEVPLPGAFGLLGSGFAGLIGFARRRRSPVPRALSVAA